MAARLESPFPTPAEFTRALLRTTFHVRRMTEEVALGAMKVCGAHAYVRSRPLERIVRDMFGGIVMAAKTDQMQQLLGRGALGMPVQFGGIGGG
jgi:alkylation response protein AidB-like acyl-CoA dehydrogenase